MKKGIIWIASYPKSGNTFVRLFLSHYMFSNNLNLEFNNLQKIPKFESQQTFQNIFKEKLINNNFIYYRHSLEAQERLIKTLPQENLFFKTHHFFGSLNGFDFTNQNNTLAYIYLVRDPREVAVSYAHHSNISIDEQLDMFLADNEINRKGFETKVNWMLSYKSWKTFQSVPNLFIKYEDLIKNPINNFSSIVYFLSSYMNLTFDLDKIKKRLNL